MVTKYTKGSDYEIMYFNTNKDLLRMACCDCGMVHSIGILMKGNRGEKLAEAKLRKNEIGIMFISEPRCTAQLRRHNYGYLQKPDKKDKYKLKRRDHQIGMDRRKTFNKGDKNEKNKSFFSLNSYLRRWCVFNPRLSGIC